MATIPANSIIYLMYGMTAPPELGGEEIYIGDIVVTEAPTTSLWSDNVYYVQHQWTEDDIAAKPEWIDYYVPYNSETTTLELLVNSAVR